MSGWSSQTAIGIGAALRTPRWLRDDRLRLLMNGMGDGTQQKADSSQPSETAMRAAGAMLRLLGRIPLLPWRNTCLYRSVAQCLVLRHLGVPCRLRIGVRRTAAPTEAMEAHAWVERPGASAADTSHVILRPGG